jgi:PadR family transcriptional regulator PadR
MISIFIETNSGAGALVDPKHFHILAALTTGPSHGYAIRQEVEFRTAGDLRLWPASLYGSLQEMTGRGWIRETPSPLGEQDDPRRRYYEVTEAGRAALAEEARRLEALAVFARARLGGGEVTS